jgi:hypothetical protein
MAVTNEARIWGVMAASGSGKGLWVKAQLGKLRAPRLVCWDPKDEYGEFAPLLVRNVADLHRAMMAAKRGGLRVRYRVKPGTDTKQRRREFEAVCTLAQAWGNCVFVAEELSQVTTPSWAPAAWSDMTTGGRHENVHIIGIAQNPALIDKTFLSNCTLIHVGPLRQYSHRQAMARSMDVPIDRITALVQFQWIERNNDTGAVSEGWSYPPGFTPTRTGTRPRRRGAAEAGRAVGPGLQSGPSTPPAVVSDQPDRRK